MALVINIGTIVNVSVIKGEKGSYYLKDSGTMGRDLKDDFLVDKNQFTELMDNIYISHPELKSEDLVISLDYGSSIEYRTVKIPKDTLIEYDKNASEEETEEYFQDIFRSYQPLGLDQLYERYVPSVLACHMGEQEATLTLAFIPQPALDNIVSYADAKGISLLGIYSFCYGIYNALDCYDELLIMDLESSCIVITPYGPLVWFKDGSYNLDDEEIKDYLVKEAASYYPIDLDSINKKEISAGAVGYYSDYLNKTNRLSRFTLSAIGCLLPVKDNAHTRTKSQVGSKGGVNNVTHSLRKFFKKS